MLCRPRRLAIIFPTGRGKGAKGNEGKISRSEMMKAFGEVIYLCMTTDVFIQYDYVMFLNVTNINCIFRA